jgi:hypothetical protein
MTARPRIPTRPIDDRARDGSYRMLFAQGEYAVARWDHAAQAFVFSTGLPVPWEPKSYKLNVGESAEPNP